MTSDASEQTSRKNRVLIVVPVITRYLTLAKIGWSTFALQFCSCLIVLDSASLFVASLLLVIYRWLFVILPVVSYSHLFILLSHCKFAFASVLFALFCSIIQCYFLFWYWKRIQGILIPITTSIWQVNKHHTTRLRNLLSWYRKQEPITIIDTRGISRTNFSKRARRGRDNFVLLQIRKLVQDTFFYIKKLKLNKTNITKSYRILPIFFTV